MGSTRAARAAGIQHATADTSANPTNVHPERSVRPRGPDRRSGVWKAQQVASSRTYAIPGAGGIVTTAGDLIDFSHALGWVVTEREGL